MLRHTAPTLLVLGIALLCGPLPGARAGDDVGGEARLLVSEGKFDEADELLRGAPEDLRNGFELRLALAKGSLRWTKRQKGAAKTPGLQAARDHFAAAMKARAGDEEAAMGAVDASLGLIEIWTEAKQGMRVDKEIDWALAAAEQAFEGGVTNAEFKAGVAELYVTRAGKVGSVEQVDRLSSDYRRAAELYVEASPEHRKAAVWLGEAAYARLAEAKFINDRIPLDEETRDDEAVVAAVELATRACGIENAKTAAYNVQLQALRYAKQWKVKGDFPEPFMEDRPREIEGLTKLRLPKADGWKSQKNEDWDFVVNRQFADERKVVQIMLRRLDWDDSRFAGLSWSDIEKITERKHESAVEQFENVVKETEAGDLAGKKENDVWFYRIAGVQTASGRQLQQAEWYWRDPDKKSKVTYNLKILDWDAPWGLEDPDVMAFVASACGQAGLVPKGKPKKGKKKRRRKKKK